MSYDGVMAVDRLSVTVPAPLGSALRGLAEQQGVSVSALVTRAIEREVRHVALSSFVDQFEETHGAFTEEELRESAAVFDRAERLAAAGPKKARSKKASAA
jgi:post-segregation antitoxin (ccd killing protein)